MFFSVQGLRGIFLPSLFVMALALASLAAVPVWADGGDGPDEVETHYQEGMEHFYRGDYALAIANFRRAYDLEPHAIFQYNISVASANLGNLNRARSAALLALELGGLPDDIELRLRSRLHAYEVELQARETAEELSSEDEVARTSPSDSATSPEVTSPPDLTVEGPADAGGLGALGWSGIAIGSLGILALGGAAFLHFDLDATMADYEEAQQDGDSQRAHRLYDEILERQSLGRMISYGGAGALVLGTALLTIDLLRSDDSSSTGDLVIAPSSSELSIYLRWNF